MTPKEKLEQIHTNDLEAKGEITALLQYANGVTGEQDTRLGDAVYRLADGYGGDSSTIVKIAGATTTESTGGGIDTGVKLGSKSAWTLLLAFNASKYSGYLVSGRAVAHSMHEATPYPGFSVDFNNTKQSGVSCRVAIGGEEIGTHNSEIGNGRHRIAMRCSNGVITVFSEHNPSGYTFRTAFNVPDTVTLCVGQIKLTTGAYDRHTALTDVNIEVHENALSDNNCIKWIEED